MTESGVSDGEVAGAMLKATKMLPDMTDVTDTRLAEMLRALATSAATCDLNAFRPVELIIWL